MTQQEYIDFMNVQLVRARKKMQEAQKNMDNAETERSRNLWSAVWSSWRLNETIILSKLEQFA